MVANIKGHLNTLLDEKVISMMNTTFSKVNWPILIYFIWKEKTEPNYDGITHRNLRDDSFNKETIRIHLAALTTTRKPFVEQNESLLSMTKYKLTPFGKKIAEMIWNVLNGYTKMFMEKTIEEYAMQQRRRVEIKIDSGEMDEEERLLREVEENNRKIEEAKRKRLGIVETPNGPVIDLAKVKA